MTKISSGNRQYYKIQEGLKINRYLNEYFQLPPGKQVAFIHTFAVCPDIGERFLS